MKDEEYGTNLIKEDFFDPQEMDDESEPWGWREMSVGVRKKDLYPDGFIYLTGDLKNKYIMVTVNTNFFKLVYEQLNMLSNISYPSEFYGTLEVHICVRDDIAEPIKIEIRDK